MNFALPDAKSLPGSEWERDVPRNEKSVGSEWPQGRRKFASPESGLKCFNKMNLLGNQMQTLLKRKCSICYLFRSLPKIVTLVI